MYCTRKEIACLLTANFYSILYYNSEILHLPFLSPQLKQKMKSVSANALKLFTPNYHTCMSFNELHITGATIKLSWCTGRTSDTLPVID